MSYCRWSSDDWKSDIYCYYDCGGYYAIHVAGRRPTVKLPPSEHLWPDIDKWLPVHKEQMRLLENTQYVDIDLPFAGESFREKTPEDCLCRLLTLRGLGYYVPEGAIERLRGEKREG